MEGNWKVTLEVGLEGSLERKQTLEVTEGKPIDRSIEQYLIEQVRVSLNVYLSNTYLSN